MIIKLQLHSRESELIAYLNMADFLLFKSVEEVNGENTTNIIISADHEFAEYFVKYNRILFYEDSDAKWHERIIARTKKQTKTNAIEIYTESALYETLSSWVNFTDLTGRTVANGITEMIGAATPTTRFIAGTSDILGSFYMQRTKCTLYTALRDWAEKVGGELQERIEVSGDTITRKIDILSRIGEDRGKVAYDDREIVNYSEEVKQGDIYTGMAGYGKYIDGVQVTFEDVEWSISAGDPADKPAGQNHITLPDEFKNEYGFYTDGDYHHRITKHEDREIEDPEELLQKTWEALSNSVISDIGYQLDLLDLQALGFESEEINLGDTIGIVVRKFNTKFKIRAIKKETNHLDKSQNRFSFGTPRKNIADAVSTTIKTAEKAASDIAANYLSSIVNAWNAEIAAGTSYMRADPSGGLSFYDTLDENTATMVLNLCAGAWRIANSKTAGEWNYRTVATGDGINGSEIYTGVLHGPNMDIDLSTGIIYFGERINGVIENPVMQFSIDGFEIIGNTMNASHTSEVMEYIAKNGNVIAYFAATGAYIPTLIVDTQIKLAKARFQPATLTIAGNIYEGVGITIND